MAARTCLCTRRACQHLLAAIAFPRPPPAQSTETQPLPLQTAIISEGFRSLREGETVEFDVETSDDGRQKAVNVTGPGGAPPEGAPRREYNDFG